MDRAVVDQLFDQGLMGIEIPEEFGGAGINFTAAVVGVEELTRADPSVSILVDVHNTLCNTALFKYASPALRRKYLPRLATSAVASFCLSEPGSGSDAFALATRAEELPAGGGFRLSGSKMWITNAAEADVFVVFANLDPARGRRGITAFVVDKGTPGFAIAKKEKKLGIRASSTCVLALDDVEVPRENLLGEPEQGYKYAMALLNEGRIGIAAQMTGLALGAFDNAARYVWNERRQFSSLVGNFQGMQHQLAQAWTELAAARRRARTLCATPPWPSCTRRRSPGASAARPSSGWAAWASCARAWPRSTGATARSAPSARARATSSQSRRPRGWT